MPFAYLTLASLRSELLQRLQDPNGVFTTATEANQAIVEGLRVLNALTYQWSTFYTFNFNGGDTWKTINVIGSPRLRTVTDTQLYNQMEAMLLEPMSGGTWTGTPQFNIGLLSIALQYRRDELLLQSAANPANRLQISPLLGVTTILADSALALQRVRWIPVDSSMPYVLGQEDVQTAQAFGPLLSTSPGNPDSWMMTNTSPLTFNVSSPVGQPGTWDMLISYAGQPFSPPTANLISIPNDWAWVAMYGALADVLANSPEATDAPRAKYCLARYEQGKKAMLKLPWLLSATVASIPVDTPSFLEMDAFLQNWEVRKDPTDPAIVVGGIDLVALAPFNKLNSPVVSSVLNVVGNAPVPVADGDQVQLSKDGVDQVLNYAQHVCSFKMGGHEFALTMPLLEQFEAYCRTKNSQYAELGIFRPQLLMEGNRSDDVNPRFEGTNVKS